MTPVTSSSLVPTSTNNESHTRSDELPARSRYAVQRVSHSFRRASRSFQIHHPRVSHSYRRASRSFQIRKSRSRSTEDRQLPCSASTTTRIRGKRTQRRSATMFAVFLLCVLRATFVHALTRQWAVRTWMIIVHVVLRLYTRCQRRLKKTESNKCSAVAMWVVCGSNTPASQNKCKETQAKKNQEKYMKNASKKKKTGKIKRKKKLQEKQNKKIKTKNQKYISKKSKNARLVDICRRAICGCRVEWRLVT